MPTYDYRCEANGRVVEVRHPMSETLSTWGELCRLAGIDPGDTPEDAPVRRLISGGYVVSSAGLANPAPACDAPGCGMGGCASGACGLE